MHLDKVVLGTAQLGEAYGIANHRGKLRRSEAFELLEYSWKSGVRHFDTAQAYQTEKLIGDFVRSHGLQAEIKLTTKVPVVSSDLGAASQIERAIDESLARLKVDQLEVVFLHNPSHVNVEILDRLSCSELLTGRIVKALGLSVYSPQEVIPAQSLNLVLAYQFPYSLVDRRFENIRMTPSLRFARSIFLQGVLATGGSLVKSAPSEIVDFHRRYHDILSKQGVDPLCLALHFVRDSKCCDHYLVGVVSSLELKQILERLELPKMAQVWDEINKEIGATTPQILDPRKW